MTERAPKRQRHETGGRRGMHENANPSELLAGIGLKGLGKEVGRRRQREFEVQSHKTDPEILQVALEIAHNDTRRLLFNDDGSIIVKNNPTQEFSRGNQGS